MKTPSKLVLVFCLLLCSCAALTEVGNFIFGEPGTTEPGPGEKIVSTVWPYYAGGGAGILALLGVWWRKKKKK